MIMATYYPMVFLLFCKIYVTALPLVVSEPLHWKIDSKSQLMFEYKTVFSLKYPSVTEDSTIGFNFDSNVEVSIAWSSKDSTLLKIVLTVPKLTSISRAASSKQLAFISKHPLYVLCQNGRIEHLYAANDDKTLSVNLKKGIASLLQITKGQRSSIESDISGDCQVKYDVQNDNLILKTKSDCKSKSINKLDDFRNSNPIFDIENNKQSTILYKLNSDDELLQATSTEFYESFTRMNMEISNAVISEQILKFVKKSDKNRPLKDNSLDGALKSINRKGGKFRKIDMEADIDLETTTCPKSTCSGLVDLLNKIRNDLTQTDENTSTAFIKLVRAIRISNPTEIESILKSDENSKIKNVLIDASIAAQTKSSLDAVKSIIDLENDEITERFLLASAFLTHPTDYNLQVLLDYFKENKGSDNVRESIAGALGAVLYTYSKQDKNKIDNQLIDLVLKEMSYRLDECEKSKSATTSCLIRMLRALGNSGQSSIIDTLLRYAILSNSSDVNEAALKSLRRMPKLDGHVLKTMKLIYHQEERGYDMAVRSLAFRYLIKNNPNYDDILDIIRSLDDPYNTETATFVKAYLFDMMSDNDKIKDMVKRALKESPKINTYFGLATKGKSLSFHNPLTDTKTIRSFQSAFNLYVENSRSGVMKRSGMDVDLNGLPVYSFNIFSAGIENLLGEETDDVNAIPTAGLALDMLGIGFRPITFFTGQTGLMSAVWNAPSDMTSALKSNMLLQDRSTFIRLSNGLIIQYNLQGAISMDLSGKISVSLWNKNAHTHIQNTAAFSVNSQLKMLTIAKQFDVSLQHDFQTKGIIDFKSDVDFYDKLKSCLTMGRPSVESYHVVEKKEKLPGFKKYYLHRRKRSRISEAISYPLPKKNNDMCRVMLKN